MRWSFCEMLTVEGAFPRVGGSEVRTSSLIEDDVTMGKIYF